MSTSQVIEVRGPDDCGLRLEFVRVGDRYSHRISVVAGRRNWPVLAAVEGVPSDPWPVSPPLQQLHVEPRASGRNVALLVGMAGRGHWSLSAEPSQDPPALVIDVACRTSVPPEHLGSRYELAEGLQATASDEALRLQTAEDPSVTLIVTADQSVGRLQWDGHRGLDVLAAAVPSSFPATIRWRYQLRWASSRGSA